MLKKNSFRFCLPLNLKKTEDGEWRVRGIASTEDKDAQGEIVKQNGLDIGALKAGRGLFNEDHRPGFENVIGKVDYADLTPKGLYIEGYLFKKQPKAQAIYNILNSLKAEDRHRVQMSIEGKIKKREGSDKTVISRAVVDKVALTLDPINPKTYVELVKSLVGAKDEDKQEESQTLSDSTNDNSPSLEDGGENFPNNSPSSILLDKSETIEYLDSKIRNFSKNNPKDNSFQIYDEIVIKSQQEPIILKAIREMEDFSPEYIELVLEKSKVNQNLNKEVVEDIINTRKYTIIKKDKVNKALEVGHEYANTLPHNMTGAPALTRESLDAKKEKRKKKMKEIIKRVKKAHPGVNLEDIVQLAFRIYEEKHAHLMEKGKKYPVGTVHGGYKKVAEGKWVPVKKEKKPISPQKEKKEFGKKIEWGFDQTDFGRADKFKSLLTEMSLPLKAKPQTYKTPGGNSYGVFVFEKRGLKLVTKNDPITGNYADGSNVRKPQEGYAGYIGIEGNENEVKKIVGLIKKKASSRGDESKGNRDFI